MKSIKLKLPTPLKPRRFFDSSAIAMAAIVVLSFPLTYFLPVMTGSQQFHLLHHVHGVAFFAWIGLYVLQTQLAAPAIWRATAKLA